MKANLMCFVGEDRKRGVIVKAIAADEVDVFVSSDDLTDAISKIKEGYAQIDAALAEWTPEKEEEQRKKEEARKQQKHYLIGEPVEDMKADQAAFEDTDRGRRFMVQLKNAHDFHRKHSKHGGLRWSEILYLSNKSKGSLIEGFFDVYALAFRHGFNACKKEAAKKATAGKK